MTHFVAFVVGVAAGVLGRPVSDSYLRWKTVEQYARRADTTVTGLEHAADRVPDDRHR